MISFGYRSRVGCILRALVAIALGLVLVFYNNTSVTLVKIVSLVLAAAGIYGLVYALTHKSDPTSDITKYFSIADIVVALLLFCFPTGVATFIVLLLALALVFFGALQLLAYIGVMSVAGLGWIAILLSAFVIVGGIVLLFNPFGIRVMSVVAGLFLIVYGGTELCYMGRVNRAIRETTQTYVDYGPDEQ